MVKMNGYYFKNFKKMMGRDGYVFSGSVMKNKKEVCRFFNDGCGGCTSIDPVDRDLYKELVNWYKDFCKKNDMEKKDNDYDSVEDFIYDLWHYEDSWKFFKKEAKKDKREVMYPELVITTNKVSDFSYKQFTFVLKANKETQLKEVEGAKVEKVVYSYEALPTQKDIEMIL